MPKIVIALGGNAIASENSFKDEELFYVKVASVIVDFLNQGYQIAIVHGNGPQIGELVLDVELAHKLDHNNKIFSLDVFVAFTQGYIGYCLQHAINNELVKRGILQKALSLVTQVVVDSKDGAFLNPSKPIGKFYSDLEAKDLLKQKKIRLKKDGDRGWRRVVASPKPIDIIEKYAIKELLELKHIVICCGGGGVPIIKSDNNYSGIEAVIDKDYTATVLAEFIEADLLIIITAVDYVSINFNKPNQQEITFMDIKAAKKYIAEKQFLPGSMLPKIEAAINFLEIKPNAQVLITSLNNLRKKNNKHLGTWISNNLI